MNTHLIIPRRERMHYLGYVLVMAFNKYSEDIEYPHFDEMLLHFVDGVWHIVSIERGK